MTIGLANFRDPAKLWLPQMLLMPLGKRTRSCAPCPDGRKGGRGTMMDLFKKVSETSAAEVRQKLETAAAGDFTLLDVREPVEYERGHLPGALHIPLSRLADRLGELDRSKPVVTY